jgi:metallo-beta-lactamase family protein
MEEDARLANKYGFSRHQPALPLFGREDAEATLKLFKPVPFHQPHIINNSISFEFFRAGHILGASYIQVRDLKSQKTILFSGDIGRDDDPITLPPEIPPASDTIVMESTYGNRLHGRGDVSSQLAELINATARRGGTVVIPVFAVGRSQLLMHYLTELRLADRIPHLPVFLDSPMATSASELYCRRTEEHRLTRDQCMQMCEYVTYVRSVEESKQLTREKFPKVILSANGMATGGRILHHIKAYGVDPRNSLLFVGYQSPETRGAKLLEGQREIKIHGLKIEIRAAVHAMDDLSAHADQQELLKWIQSVPKKPQSVFLTHGEPDASQTLAERIRSKTACATYIPDLTETVEL